MCVCARARENVPLTAISDALLRKGSRKIARVENVEALNLKLKNSRYSVTILCTNNIDQRNVLFFPFFFLFSCLEMHLYCHIHNFILNVSLCSGTEICILRRFTLHNLGLYVAHFIRI